MEIPDYDVLYAICDFLLESEYSRKNMDDHEFYQFILCSCREHGLVIQQEDTEIHCFIIDNIVLCKILTRKEHNIEGEKRNIRLVLVDKQLRIGYLVRNQQGRCIFRVLI